MDIGEAIANWQLEIASPLSNIHFPTRALVRLRKASLLIDDIQQISQVLQNPMRPRKITPSSKLTRHNDTAKPSRPRRGKPARRVLHYETLVG